MLSVCWIFYNSKHLEEKDPDPYHLPGSVSNTTNPSLLLTINLRSLWRYVLHRCYYKLYLFFLPAHCGTFRSRAGCPCTSGQWGRSRGTRPCTRNTRRKYFIIRAGSLAIFRANTLNGKGSLSGRVITGTIVSPFLTEYIFTWVLLTSVDIFRTINNFSKNLL